MLAANFVDINFSANTSIAITMNFGKLSNPDTLKLLYCLINKDTKIQTSIAINIVRSDTV